jgi:hypothetical protein
MVEKWKLVKHDGCDCNDDNCCYDADGAEDSRGSGYEDSFSDFTDFGEDGD